MMGLLNTLYKRTYGVILATVSLGFSAILLGASLAIIARLFMLGWDTIWYIF